MGFITDSDLSVPVKGIAADRRAVNRDMNRRPFRPEKAEAKPKQGGGGQNGRQQEDVVLSFFQKLHLSLILESRKAPLRERSSLVFAETGAQPRCAPEKSPWIMQPTGQTSMHLPQFVQRL